MLGQGPRSEFSEMYDFSVLRSLRKRNGLTIADVAGRSGVSPAVISRLERNLSKAELETLFRISRVFDVSASDLLQLAERPLAHRISETSRESAGFEFRQVAYGNMRCLIGTAPAGGWVSRPDAHAASSAIATNRGCERIMGEGLLM